MGKKRKCYFNNSQKEKKSKLKFGHNKKLSIGMKGFLITYNCKFTFMLNEAKKLIQQFSVQETVDNKQAGSDLEKELQAELNSLNTLDKELNILDTGAKYSIFINLDSADPNQVVESIFEHIETTKKPLGRHVQRILPILNTCKSFDDDIEKCLESTLDQLDAIKESDSALNKEQAKPFKYYCVFKTSNNGSLSRENIFKIVGNYMSSKNKANKVDFSNADYVVIINVVCNMCFLSFVKNFDKYRKFNLIEMGAKFTPILPSPANTNKKHTQDTESNIQKSEEIGRASCRERV